MDFTHGSQKSRLRSLSNLGAGFQAW